MARRILCPLEGRKEAEATTSTQCIDIASAVSMITDAYVQAAACRFAPQVAHVAKAWWTWRQPLVRAGTSCGVALCMPGMHDWASRRCSHSCYFPLASGAKYTRAEQSCALENKKQWARQSFKTVLGTTVSNSQTFDTRPRRPQRHPTATYVTHLHTQQIDWSVQMQ